MCHTYIELPILKSSMPWSSQLWTQFKRMEAWRSQNFNGVWTRDLAIPVRRSNQLSYETTDVGSWSFVISNEPVKNGCEVIYEIMAYLISLVPLFVCFSYLPYLRSLAFLGYWDCLKCFLCLWGYELTFGILWFLGKWARYRYSAIVKCATITLD